MDTTVGIIPQWLRGVQMLPLPLHCAYGKLFYRQTKAERKISTFPFVLLQNKTKKEKEKEEESSYKILKTFYRINKKTTDHSR